MKIGILNSGFTGYYIGDFLSMCNEKGITVDIFNVMGQKLPYGIKFSKIYELSAVWNMKKTETYKLLENEIKSVCNVDEYDYFICDVVTLSFKNACNLFHIHTVKYKTEHTAKNIIAFVSGIIHRKIIEHQSEYYKNTKLCIVGSKEMKQDYHKNCNIKYENIKIIPPGINNQESETKNNESSNKYPFVFGAVTCGFDLKGGYIILKALRKLKKEYSSKEIRFKFINPSYNRQWQLKLYIKLFGLGSYVEFLPFQNNINKFYEKIDSLVCVSKSEAFGRVVTEAMSFGLPVVVASNVGASDVIRDGYNGYIVRANEKISLNLAEKITYILNHRQKNNRLIKPAAKKASHLTWRNFAAKLFNYIYYGEK